MKTTERKTEHPKPKTILLFDNLNIAVCNEAGEQIPELQRSVAHLLAMHAEQCGYDLDGCVIETKTGNWRIFRTDDGSYNHARA